MIQFQNVSFSYGDLPILKDFSFELKNGEQRCIVGPSGCGKSTLLKLLLGFAKPQKGIVSCDSASISTVFQEDRLLPFYTVKENIQLVNPKSCDALLEAFHLSDFSQAYPKELSGGMARRVACARALHYDGEVFLLDEPFTGLDEKLKQEVLHIFKSALQNKTVLLITHREEEAEALEIPITLWDDLQRK